MNELFLTAGSVLQVLCNLPSPCYNLLVTRCQLVSTETHLKLAPSHLRSTFLPMTFTFAVKQRTFVVQSQKTKGSCVADFATLSDERMSRSKIFLLLTWFTGIVMSSNC